MIIFLVHRGTLLLSFIVNLTLQRRNLEESPMSDWSVAISVRAIHGGLNMLGPVTIRRCGPVGVGVTLLEEMCQCGGGFKESFLLAA